MSVIPACVQWNADCRLANKARHDWDFRHWLHGYVSPVMQSRAAVLTLSLCMLPVPTPYYTVLLMYMIGPVLVLLCIYLLSASYGLYTGDWIEARNKQCQKQQLLLFLAYPVRCCCIGVVNRVFGILIHSVADLLSGRFTLCVVLKRKHAAKCVFCRLFCKPSSAGISWALTIWWQICRTSTCLPAM